MLQPRPPAALSDADCHERERLALLAGTGLLDTEASEAFDRVTRLAASLFKVPIALISFADERRQWFKSRHGLDVREIDRDIAFCSRTTEQTELLVIEDTLLDPRFAANPLVLGDPGIRFYAGAPLRLRSGHALGALCLVDRVPRRFGADERARLVEMAALVMTQIELHQRAGHVNEVTRLPNRAQLAEDLETCCRTHPGERRALALLDVMSDRRLQAAVRAVGIRPLEASLREIAAKLQTLLGSRTTLYHVSDTRFAFLLPGQDSAAQDTFASALLTAMREPFSTGGIEIDLIVQAGLAEFTLEATATEDVLRKATCAMHEATMQRQSHLWHSARFDVQHRRTFALLRHVPASLASGQFRLVFQPKLDLKLGRYSGVEALARWEHPRYGNISPAEFIPLIESTALIQSFTAWVIDAALVQLRAWHDNGLELTVAVNVSSRNLERDGFVDDVRAACDRHGVAARYLHIECTEHSVMTSNATQAALEALQATGFQVSLDDFGMGFSNLACLSALPVQLLKLDRSLIAPITTSPRALDLVRSLIQTGHLLGYRMLAEGVEDLLTLGLLIEADCDEIQGYVLSRPLASTDVAAFMTDGDSFTGAAQPSPPNRRTDQNAGQRSTAVARSTVS